MKNVLVLGGSGMLGSMLVDVLSREPDMNITATARDTDWIAAANERIPNVRWQLLDVTDTASLQAVASGQDWILNAVGIIKPFISADNPPSVQRAIAINADFPYQLAKLGIPVIQIATDCTFSGQTGHYNEDAAHDPLDIYGKSKSLGEVVQENFYHLRCSIIGPESKAPRRSLLEWFLAQPEGVTLNGFTNHHWNGVTTLHFALLCLPILRGEVSPRLDLHVIPSDEVSKFDMLLDFAAVYGRDDLTIHAHETAVAVDRTLATCSPDENATLWEKSGYSTPPTIRQMIEELAAFDYRLYL